MCKSGASGAAFAFTVPSSDSKKASRPARGECAARPTVSLRSRQWRARV